MRRFARPALALAALAALAASAGAQVQPSVDDLIARRVAHVFIIYQENRSFDSTFGTFPGADGVWSASAREHGFEQRNPLTQAAVTPFRIVEPDVDDADHTRASLYARIGDGRMDRFVADEAERNLRKGATPAQASAMGELTMAHIDCDTIPFLWYYASRFTLFDRFFQGTTGPSTPGNITLIAAQTGLTQLARHPEQAVDPDDRGPGEPVLNDLFPQYGPYNKSRKLATKQFDQLYANVLLELEEADAKKVVNDGHDVREDERAIAGRNKTAVPWTWYQEGYDDPADPERLSYVTHHNAPQYFGYVVENEVMRRHLADLTQFYRDVEQRRLPQRGVFFIKGGYQNVMGLRPANPDALVQRHFLGDDDHPAYADSQISQAFVARTVNAIAQSPYWDDAAIVIVWDDSEGFWDHVPPPRWERCPDGHPCGDGPRVPAILISPFARDGAIVHDLSDHISVTKFIETVFGLPSLAALPDEKPYLPMGPRDGNGELGNLAGAFDPDRLEGGKPALSGQAATIPREAVWAVPTSWNCASIKVTPQAPPLGSSDAPPADFNPRPYEPRATNLNPNAHGP